MVRLAICLVLSFQLSGTLAAQQFARAPGATHLTLDAAIAEALQNNLELLATRVGVTIADASLVTARLRPNPVLSLGGDHLDFLGTGFNDVNGAGPPEVQRPHRLSVRAWC